MPPDICAACRTWRCIQACALIMLSTGSRFFVMVRRMIEIGAR